MAYTGGSDLPFRLTTLRFFDAALEKRFAEWIYSRRRTQMLLAMGLVMFLYVLLGLLDRMLSPAESVPLARTLHLFVVVPVLALSIVAGIVLRHRLFFLGLAVTATVTAAGCHLLLLSKIGLENAYVPELYFMILWTFVIAGFRLWCATVIALGIAAAAAAVVWNVSDADGARAIYFFWLFVSLTIGLLGGHIVEYFAKSSFVTTVRLEAEVAEVRQMQESLRHSANHDVLTGVPNRALFNDRFAGALVRAKRLQNRLALIFVDLDRFKQLNDTEGHAAGDRLLQTVADRLLSCIREADTVGRLGGDEFVVLLTDVVSVRAAIQVAEAICRCLDACGEDGRRCSASLGVALYPDHGTDKAALLAAADAAMYRAKNDGGNCVRLAA